MWRASCSAPEPRPWPITGKRKPPSPPSDFVHKMRLCLKELRESYRWLMLCRQVPLITPKTKLDAVLAETD